ncbi:MAG: hypothetical protein ACI8UO_004363, partial [Verrucomicrobiales bacterium]
AGSGQLDCLRFELFGKSFSRLLHLVSGLSTGPGIYRTSDLDSELEDAIADVKKNSDRERTEFETLQIKPLNKNIEVKACGLASMRELEKAWLCARTMVMALAGLLPAVLTQAADKPDFVFVCSADNDLYRVVTESAETAFPRFATAAEAVEAASREAGVLILADGYPDTATTLDKTVLEEAAGKQLRLYVEYPVATAFPEFEIGESRQPHWERTVVASNAFGTELERLRILQINDCHFLPVTRKASPAGSTHLVSARVAGYDTAVYGLPDETWPLLFEHGESDILIATTKLSQFVSARYAPNKDWGIVWEMIFGWLASEENVEGIDLKWTQTVRPSFSRDEPLRANEEERARQRGIEWFENFLVDESWKDELAAPAKTGYGPADPKRQTDRPVGDGQHGILEGHISKVFADGSQPMRWLLRGDCNAESAMALALGGRLDDNPRQRVAAVNLMDFVYFNSDLFHSDPNSSSFGLLGWYSYNSGPNSFWGNDGSKAIVGSLTAAAALENERWDEQILASILANFRTTGPLGFRDGMPINAKQLDEHGWEHFARRRTITPWPQREAWAWACYLWLYDKTQYQPLLVQARKAIRTTMQRYPDGWGYALNEMQMERGRMLLPLAWLVRADDTEEHRAWLRQVVDDMLARQDSSGAIQEQLRATSHRSNEAYGTGEVSILHEDGDPCSDVFYSVPPAFLGLVEAAAATGDPVYAKAADKVAEFLVRVQVRSEAHPTLDGGWFRAFDFEKWDYWGGNGDSGWGAWSSETGWVQSHIVAAMAMRERETSLWEFTADSGIAAHFERYHELMEIDKAVAIMNEAMPQQLDHLARGKELKANVAPDKRHPGSGVAGLTDGLLGEPHDLRLEWMGFRGTDLEATIDLGETVAMNSVSVRFLQSIADGMIQPRQVEWSVSDDGKTFRTVTTRQIEEPVERDAKGLTLKPQVLKPGPKSAAVRARFVRFRAESAGPLPDWHSAAGNPSWLFIDEIVVE